MTPAAATLNPNYLDERALRALLCSGEHAAVMHAYLGAEVYGELRELAQQAATAKPASKAPTVYVLPGLLGSKLGITRNSHMQLYWFDPATLIPGYLTELTIGKRRSMRVQGVMLPGYIKLKLMLEIAGFKTVFHPYDWRRSARDLGRQFAEVLQDDHAKDIMIVAHSMGGLVARVALKHLSGAKVSRVVQLGTPNLGSFGLVQALRASYPTVRKLGAADLQHSAEQLSQQVFRSFYSLHEMLPLAGNSTTLDLFDVRQWPQDELTPRMNRLKEARRLQKHLAIADRRCHAIVGIDQPTATDISLRNNEFVYHITRAGDGTVPAALAHWQGAAHWYAQATHGQLPRNTVVCQATIDLLRNETTTRLPSTWRAANETAIYRSEHELHALLNGKVKWDQLPLAEKRDLLEPNITATFAGLCQPAR
jgi:pimeloyl-ACP methyl ester carboxylesterase